MNANEFFTNTKKMFRSCKYAVANLEETIGMRTVWGDFTSKKQAQEAANMWMFAFREFSPKFDARIEGKAYRIVITF